VDENDLTRLLSLIQTTDHDQILITHGYQTMANTMKWLKKKVQKAEKETIILFVDSLIPLNEPDSDGPDQLTAAHHILATGNS
jgi:L-asparaginase/Glu-tRNA(Gln) amidotransferase subunit D